MKKRNKPLWYLSFVDTDENKFLGGCVVHGVDAIDAVKTAWKLRINPGGEVLAGPIENNIFPLNKLMNKKELASFSPIHRYGDMKRTQIIERN